jgi:2-hydroxychromene-2-carboxylate isomerase
VIVSASFYFDLQSPLAYLAAERVLHELPAAAEWQPVLARELSGSASEPSGGAGDLAASSGLPGAGTQASALAGDSDAFRAEIAGRAQQLGLQPLRWPQPFPFDSELAMLAATYAKSIGRVVPFAQAAFRQAFAGGRDLEQPDNVVIAAAACEMHPSAVLRGTELRSVASQLRAATNAAIQAQVKSVPAIVIDGVVFDGERAIERAAAEMHALAEALAR